MIPSADDDAREYARQMYDYSNMGESRPISTDWVHTGEKRTVNGATEWYSICRLCGEGVWTAWGLHIAPHECSELEYMFGKSTEPTVANEREQTQ